MWDLDLGDLGGFNLDTIDWMPNLDTTLNFDNLDFEGLSPTLPAGGNTQPMQDFLQLDRDPALLSEGWYQGGLNAGGGDFGKAGEWLGARRESGLGMDAPLRNAQHGMGQMELESRAPGVGVLNSFTGVPAYSAAKGVVQNLGPGLGEFVDPLTGMSSRSGVDLNEVSKYLFGSSGDLMGASRPSAQEVWWGMRPIWNYFGR